MDKFDQRIRQVERGLARMRMLCVALACTIIFLVCHGASPSQAKTIEVSELRLIDAQGKCRVELRTDAGENKNEAGLVFYDASGTNLGRLTANGPRMLLRMEESAASRLTGALFRLSLLAENLSAKQKAEIDWETFTKDQLKEAQGLGPLSTAISPGSVMLIDNTKDRFTLTSLDTTALAAPAVTVGGISGIPNLGKGTIQVLDGSVTVRDSKSKRAAVLGKTKITNTKTGALTDLQPSSLTLFGEDGKVLFSAP